jgi:hypothetical protein
LIRKARNLRKRLLLSGAVVLAGCQTADRPADGVLALRIVDSVILEEPDSAFLGRPGALFRTTDDGDYLIPDELANRLLRFAPDGRFVASYGRSGAGPGEFRRIGHVSIIRDSILLQSTLGRELHFFRLSDGAPLFQRVHRGYITSGLLRADSLFMGVFALDSGMVTVIAAPAESIFAPDPRTPPLVIEPTKVRLPRLYRDYRGLDAFGGVFLDVTHTAVVVAFGGSNDLLISDHDLEEGFELSVPRRLRRGVTTEGLRKLSRADPNAAQDEVFEAISATQGVWVLRDGRILVWHGDLNVERRNGRVQQIAGITYLTLLSADLGLACVDARLEAPGTAKPRIAVHRDTVLSLDQIAEVKSNRAVTVIRRYALADDGCEWLPTTRTTLRH